MSVAFFHAPMDEHELIYVKPPGGQTRTGEDIWWELLKAMYGTRKAAAGWHTEYS